MRLAGSAVVQDWFIAPGGSEEVAIELARLLPGSEIHTSFIQPAYRARLDGHPIRPWPFQRLFGPTRHFRAFLPAYPLYFSLLDLRRFQLVVSSSVAFTHAVRRTADSVHVAYVYTPLRYAWNLEAYLQGSSWSPIARAGARLLRPWLQRWDRSAASRPDVLVAISEAVRRRIREHWGRDAEVIHPPVDVAGIPVSEWDDGFLLVAARMLAYRRLDIAVEAATRLNRDLVVVGDGPERRRLQATAGPRVRFLGRVERPVLLDLFQRCHAYLVPGVEDFGMAPVEAMAAGKPVVGYRAGGVGETVVDGTTGTLFDRQDTAAMADAIERLDSTTFDPAVIRANAERFATPVFRRKFIELLERLGVDRSLYRAGA